MACCAKRLPHSSVSSRKNVTVTKKSQIKLLKRDILFSSLCGWERQSSMVHVVYEGGGGQIANTGPCPLPKILNWLYGPYKRMKTKIIVKRLPASPHGSSDKNWLPYQLKTNRKMMLCLPVVI